MQNQLKEIWSEYIAPDIGHPNWGTKISEIIKYFFIFISEQINLSDVIKFDSERVKL